MGRPHVLIAGAAGFVGGACTREFLSRGWNVTALVHRRISRMLLDAAGPQLRLVAASVADLPGLSSGLSAHVRRHGPIDAVVNCTGRTTDIGPRRRFMRTNVVGTANLVACMHALDIDHLVHVSTTDVYGLRDFRSADEDTPLDRSAKNPYPASKILAEDAVRSGLPQNRWTLLRPGVVWGPGDTTILPRIVDYLRACPWIVHFGRHHGRNRWPLVYARNVALAAFGAVVSPCARGGCYNLVDAERTSVDDYYRMLLNVFAPNRHDMRSVTLPFAVGCSLGAVSTFLSNRLGLDRPVWHPSLYEVRSVSCELDFSRTRFDALLKSCGLTAVGLDAGMEDLQDWAGASVDPFDTHVPLELAAFVE